MSKPNMYCGECPYWLAFGEPETTDEQNEAILAHCAECDFDPEVEEARQEAHSNLVCSLVEAGGEIRELKEMLREAKDALLYMLVLHDSTHGHNMREAVQILYHLQSDNRWNVQKAKETLKKISEYCEQEDTE